jgi:hypothetical protein
MSVIAAVSAPASALEGSMLDALGPLLLRHIALSNPDPSGLAGACRSCWAAVSDERFLLQWFHRWQPLLVPYRSVTVMLTLKGTRAWTVCNHHCGALA